jgi:outer membrane protein OmpA-like peptidoglycan-associated protein
MKRSLLISLLILFNLSVFSQKKGSQAQEIKRYKYLTTQAFKINNFTQSLFYGKKLDSLQPNQTETIYVLGVSYLYSATKIDALDYLLKANARNYKPNEINYYLGQAYHYNNEFDLAIKHLNKHLKFIDTTGEGSTVDKNIYEDVKSRIGHCLLGQQMKRDSLHIEIKNLGSNVNTKFSEYNPVVNADESIMYFTSRRHGGVHNKHDIDNKHFEDVFVSYNENGEWKTPKNLGPPINVNDHDACIGISPDGQKLFIYRSKSGKSTMGNILVSTLDGNQWQKPKKLGSNINSRSGWESSICLSPDGKRLYFSSDRDGGFGGLDIYSCDLGADGEWGKATNLGSRVNTSDNEDAPFMHFDGKTLFFSSDGHKTVGGFDIFATTFQVDSSAWSLPRNLGYPINTGDDDMYFVYSANGTRGYFSSHRRGNYGEKDVYVVNRPNADPNMIVAAGHVLDKETNQPVFATITITNLETQKVIGVFNTNKLTGKYVLALNFGVNHSVEIEADGYVFKSENINIGTSEFKFQHNQDFYMEKPKAGAKVTLNNIFFDFEKATLRPESATELDNIFEAMTNNPGWVVEISGHTDSVGPMEYNQKLSKARAMTVVNYLIEKGVNARTLIPVGYGETKPVADNGTEPGRQQNRRTDFLIQDVTAGTASPTDSIKLPTNIKSLKDEAYKLNTKVHFMANDGEHLTQYSIKQIDKVVDIAKGLHHFKVKLLPSVDLVGDEYNNKKLYDLRASTVVGYLVEKGMKQDKILVEPFVPTNKAKVSDVSKADIKMRKVEFLIVE